MKRLSIAATLLVAGATLIANGCKGREAADGGGSSGRAPSTKRISKKDRALGRKLEHYIRCINRYSRGVMNSRRRYLSWIKKPEVGPTCKEAVVRGLPKLNASPAGCVRGLRRVRAAVPKLPSLEQAGDRFAKALEGVAPLIDQAARYYQRKEYKADDCAGAKKLHPELVAAFDAFAEADKRLREAIDRVNRDLQRRELARTAKIYGEGLRYHHKKLMIEARRTLNALREQSRRAKPEIKVIAATMDRFQATVDAMEATSQKRGDVAAKVSWWSSFKREAFEFLRAGKAFYRRKKSGRAFSRYERDAMARGNGWVVSGSFPKVVREYNGLVSASNNVRFQR